MWWRVAGFPGFGSRRVEIPAASFVVGFALGDDELLGGADAFQFVDQTIGFVDAAAPIAVPAAQGFGFAKARVAVALDVLDKKVDALEGLFVLQLPLGVFLPGAGREKDVYVVRGRGGSGAGLRRARWSGWNRLGRAGWLRNGRGPRQ